ncbi:MAG: gliding motility-associated C-terminal domain-containing protein, partial [Ferruginibacter sp.]|nr:gliding motility-associated C-terminal domain-containing protein [Ferruginibacter sp.]
CANSNIFVPTAFTPNRDGLNDLLHPISRGINEIDHFIIYNRLGVKMYEISHVSAKDNNWGWDGTYRGIAQPQTSYIYILQAVCDAGETITTKGSFVLLR